MAVLQDININVHGQPSEKRLQTFLRLSQNENGRMINFRVLGAPLPSNCTATFSGTKPDGNVYSKAGTVTGNFVIIEEDIQMTAVAGVWDAKLDIINGTHNIMTALIRVIIDADVVDPDAIASDSQLQGLVAEAKYYAEHARTDAYGSPLTATTAAEMTDKTRVYVYTGSESGMTAGNWYYWNGSAWTSGGVYNAVAVQTDTTLSVAGKAADAKKTGDEIDSVRSDLGTEENTRRFEDDNLLLAIEAETARAEAEEARIETLFTGDVSEAVNDWLDEHPEATTSVEDHSLTMDKLVVGTLGYVTPEDFGAVGDGIADDTNAVQAAMDSEKNVCLIGKYLIKRTLVFSKSGKWGKNIFAPTQVRWAQHCQLFFNLDDRTTPCIELQSDGLTMQNVCVRGVDTRNQTFIKTNISYVDVDMSLIGCSIYNFGTIVDIVGRGLDMSNCVVAGCSVIAKIAWKTEGTGVYHNDDTGQRAYNFCNNRFHSMSAASKPMIQVSSGNVYGFRFINNNFDRGYSSLLLAESNVKDWLICGNTFNGVMGYGSNNRFIMFEGNVEQVTISDNVFTVVETAIATSQIVGFVGEVNGFIFANNSIGETFNASVIVFNSNMSNVIIAHNTWLKNKNMSTHRAFLFTAVGGNTIKNAAIVGNVIPENTVAEGKTANQYILRCSGGLTLKNVKMIGNIKPYANSNPSDYSIGTPTIDRCLFDWTLATNS